MKDRHIKRVGLFIAGKGVGLSLEIWAPRKALKSLLQNIFLMLDLLYYKHKSIITTVVDGSIFKKIFKTIIREKNVSRRYYFYAVVSLMEL